jgi:arylmalonate decarboxylase
MLGTSLSFFRGPAFNRTLEDSMRTESGAPCVTATSAVVAALGSAKRLAVGTAYDEDMNARLRAYFEQSGFEIAGLVGMNIRKVREAMSVADDAIIALAEKACAQAPGADALLLSCGAFATGHLLGPLRERYGVPVVSTTAAALAAAYALAQA